MRHVPTMVRRWVAIVAIGACTVPVFAQGPGGAPGMPMQRLGPTRGQATGMGTPGMPMPRMGRGGGIPQASPTQRNYRGMAGVGVVTSSQGFRASNFAGQARGAGIQRSSSGIVSGATRGMLSRPDSPR